MVGDFKTGKSRYVAASEAVVIAEYGGVRQVIGLEDVGRTESAQGGAVNGRGGPPQVLLVVYVVIAEGIGIAEAEDAGFYITGDDLRSEEFVESLGVWKLLNYIRHGKSDMLVFGVNEGLATMPEN